MTEDELAMELAAAVAAELAGCRPEDPDRNGDGMNNIGKTLLRGHALQDEGKPRWTSYGEYVFYGQHAMCECGELAPPGISQKAAQRWHREHKDSLRTSNS